jgi:2-polyprenyl-3-methyl-5-hydroxy-6-metoxy-1,4-benzoquinol methylase
MLISLSKSFVFIAGLKVASTAIENALGSRADLALVEARFGKHQRFSEIETRFAWMLDLIDPARLFVFGVMRDPVDYMISLYNSHTDPKFKEKSGLYTGEMDFDRFLSEWTVHNHGQVKQQYLRFLDRKGRIAANYIISYEQLEHGLQFVSGHIGVRGLVPLGKVNESHGSFDRCSLNAEQSDWIEAHFAEDREILSGYCNRLLTPRTEVVFNDSSSASESAGTGPPPIDVVPAASDAAVPKNPAGSNDAPDEVVDILYRATLRRPPDESGLATYRALLRAGRSELDLVKALTASPEFAAKRLIPVGDDYDIRADMNILKHSTEDVLSMTERIQKSSLDSGAFHEAALAALKELEGNKAFHESQEHYLNVHKDRFQELACAVGSLSKDFGHNARILDFGYSINSLIMRGLFPEARITIADRPGIRVRTDRFDEILTVDLHDDHLNEIDLGKRFDIIVFSEVIEHLQVHPGNVVRFLLRHLTDGGYVMLTTPNLFGHGKLRLIGQRKSPLPPYPSMYGQADSPHFHFREYGMGEMLSTIEAAGGSVSAFFFSGCWDNPATRDATPPHELGNLFLLFQKAKAS